jgi:hypothetical protein
MREVGAWPRDLTLRQPERSKSREVVAQYSDQRGPPSSEKSLNSSKIKNLTFLRDTFQIPGSPYEV